MTNENTTRLITIPTTNFPRKIGFTLKVAVKDGTVSYQKEVQFDVRPEDEPLQEYFDSLKLRAEGIHDPIIGCEDAYYDGGSSRVILKGWTAKVTEEEIKEALLYEVEQNNLIRNAQRARAEKTLQQIKTDFPELLK